MKAKKRILAEENGVCLTEVTLYGSGDALDVAYSITTRSSHVPIQNCANRDDADKAYDELVLCAKKLR
jgi:hypothetical protein